MHQLRLSRPFYSNFFEGWHITTSSTGTRPSLRSGDIPTVMESETFRGACSPNPWAFTILFAIFGIAFHLVIRPFEVDYQILRFFCVYILIWAIFVGAYHQYCDFSIVAAAGWTSLATLCFNTGLTLSLGVYRAFFHRLNGYPGPFAARLSKAYAFSLQWKNFQYFPEQIDLRQKYGDYVRTGKTA